MDGGTPTSTRALVGTLLLVLASCAGPSPGTDSTQPDTQSTKTPAAPRDAAESDPGVSTTPSPASEPTTTTTSVAVTTDPDATLDVAPENPEIAVDEFDIGELDGLLSELEGMLGDLDSSLAQQEGELFND